MSDWHVGQRARMLILTFEVAVLCLASRLAFGSWFPPSDNRGYWFYAALLGLILSRRLDTPFYPTPADVVLYAAPAAVTLQLVNGWGNWASGERVAFTLALLYCIVNAILGIATILTKDATSEVARRFSNTSRILIEKVGTARWIYSVVLAFALYAFHRNSARELGIIVAAWVLTSLASPADEALGLLRRIRRIWAPGALSSADGTVVAYQTPGILLVRQARDSSCDAGDVLAVHDAVQGARYAVALDRVGRDEGILRRAIELKDVQAATGSPAQIASLPAGSVAKVSNVHGLQENQIFRDRARLVGLVAADTSLERLYFEVVQEEGLQQGSLVETVIGGRTVTYQLIDGLTKEEVVQQKNTRGYCRGQAQKLGEWDPASSRFRYAKWLPAINAPVFLRIVSAFEHSRDAVGHLPGTSYGVSLRDLDPLVTHNAAILGILGVGKTTLAIELVERMLSAGIRVICVDLTNQYAEALADYSDAEQYAAKLKELRAIGLEGKGKVAKNVSEGGSKQRFGVALQNDIEAFLTTEGPARLRVYNPSDFAVWKQDGKEYKESAPMAPLTPAEITQLISEATLRASAKAGVTNKARVCLVYEEAHTLIPEWNSVAAEGDRTASNGTAKAILQGRKYGLGCLLITQRTANVTKTILNQCHTIFAMRTFDDTGREFLANYIGKEHAAMLPALEERHAILFGKASSCETPVLIRLNDRDEFIRVFRAPARGAREGGPAASEHTVGDGNGEGTAT
jgi:uncharacterized protein